jgi:ADP-dependent NAD(P)H-hydrate dehydratase / NAD(P)H-hydrate epimerase
MLIHQLLKSWLKQERNSMKCKTTMTFLSHFISLIIHSTVMQKILSIDQIRQADAYTIEHEPISSIDLMERAATQAYEWILGKLSGRKPVFYVYCGPGNNGGDGLVLARLLNSSNYLVNLAVPEDEGKYSADFKINLERISRAGIKTVFLHETNNWNPTEDDVIIDSLFGSGLSKAVTGPLAEVIASINKMAGIVVSIDIPSGLFADSASIKSSAIIQADYTLSFQLPKQAFLFPENEQFVDEWIILPIGLHADYINGAACNNYFVDKEGIRPFLKKRAKFSHKGTFGHALLISGSYGKMGAAILASKACLRSGVGLITTHIPTCGYEILQTSVPEAMASVDPCQHDCSRIPDLAPYTAIGIGPGLGKSKEAANTVRLVIQDAKVPLVLDADALNILSEQKTWQAFIPAGSVLTPHPKEFERLAGKWNDGFELLRLLRDYTLRHKVFVILKGAYTITCTPSGNCFFNSSGNPGMATGGTGDVLTGILLGLLAQQYSTLDACLLGVYLHGLAGDIASETTGMEAMVAGDLINNLGAAFRKLY